MDGVAVTSGLVLCGGSKWVVLFGYAGSVIMGVVAGICAKAWHCSSHEFGAPVLASMGNIDLAKVVMVWGIFSLSVA